MKCPDCNSDLRVEYRSGFCSKCLKHHEMCNSTYYMDICDLGKGHNGKHQSSPRNSERYTKWNVNSDGLYINVEHVNVK